MARSGRTKVYFILEEVMYKSAVWRIEVLSRSLTGNCRSTVNLRKIKSRSDSAKI